MTAYTVTVEYWTPKTHDEARYSDLDVVATSAAQAEEIAIAQVEARGGSIEVTKAMAVEDETPEQNLGAARTLCASLSADFRRDA